MNSGLTLHEIVKRYRSFTLGPISLHLEPGCVHGLLGPNGAGKTTLLGSIAGQLDHDGVAAWNGHLMKRRDWRLRNKVAYVSEVSNLYEELTVDQTLRFCSLVFETWDKAVASEWRDRLALNSGKHVRELSKGMRTKLALLVGISHGATLLLLDEPTSGLDPDARREFHSILRALAVERGACVVMSSHLLEDTETVADSVLFMRDGSIRRVMAMGELASVQVHSLAPRSVPHFVPHLGDGALLAPVASGDMVDLIVFNASQLSQDVKSELRSAPHRPATLRDIYFGVQAEAPKES